MLVKIRLLAGTFQNKSRLAVTSWTLYRYSHIATPTPTRDKTSKILVALLVLDSHARFHYSR